MKISFNDFGIFINKTLIIKGISKFDELMVLLGANNRIVYLKDGLNLVIYDQLGIRFWINDSTLTEFQVIFHTSERPLFPKLNFSGFTVINNKMISGKTKKEEIKRDFDVEVDDDSCHYNLDILYITVKGLRICSMQFDDKKEIRYISK